MAHPHRTHTADGVRNSWPYGRAARARSSRTPGNAPNTRASACSASMRASDAPRQKCLPAPKARWSRVGTARVEVVGIGKVRRIPVGGAQHALNGLARRNLDATDLDSFGGEAGAGLNRRLPPHRLLDHGLDHCGVRIRRQGPCNGRMGHRGPEGVADHRLRPPAPPRPPERSDEAPLEPDLLVAIGGEHVRPEDVADGRRGRVGGEALPVGEDPQDVVAAREQPHPQLRRPGHRLRGPQLVEEGVWIVRERVNGHPGSEREPDRPVSHALPPVLRQRTGSRTDASPLGCREGFSTGCSTPSDVCGQVVMNQDYI